MSIQRVQPATSLLQGDAQLDGSEINWRRKKQKVGIYSGLITQTGTADPEVIVLQNSLGINLTWTRGVTGQYLAEKTGGGVAEDFPLDKTWMNVTNEVYTVQTWAAITNNEDGTIQINTKNSAGADTDGLLFRTGIEIRVYE